ncbi:MAG TPA: hypothetical protein VFT20_05800 [Candidatus Limnocylindrales bacterium]|nr:hypothetical protein [Candidatus Limnocylindrales bacterium]
MLDTFELSKPAVTRLFGVAVALVVAGAVIGIVAVIGGLANGAVALGGPQVVTINAGPVAWTIAGLVAASSCGAAGTITAIAAWAGALLNTYRLEDKTWFLALLVTGLISLGWVAMFAYVFAGPDSNTAHRATDRGVPTADQL